MIAFQYNPSSPSAPGQGIHFYEKSGATTVGGTIAWEDPQFSIMDTIVKFDERVNVGISNGAPAAKLVINNGTSGNGSSGSGLAVYTNSSNPSIYAINEGTGYTGSFTGVATAAHQDPLYDDYSVLRAENTSTSSTGIGIIGVGNISNTAIRGSYGVAGFGRSAIGSTGRSVGVYGYSEGMVVSTGTRAGIWGQVASEDDGYAYGVYGYNPGATGDLKNFAIFASGDFGAPNNFHGASGIIDIPGQPDGPEVMCPQGRFVCGIKYWNSSQETSRLTDIICCDL